MLALLLSDERHCKPTVVLPRLRGEDRHHRILRDYDLITSPNYIVMAASDKFHTPTTRINEMWQTDFTYFKVIGWGWFFLSTVLDDYSRRILSWKLFTSMKAEDVQETLDMAIAETGTDQVISLGYCQTTAPAISLES